MYAPVDGASSGRPTSPPGGTPKATLVVGAMVVAPKPSPGLVSFPASSPHRTLLSATVGRGNRSSGALFHDGSLDALEGIATTYAASAVRTKNALFASGKTSRSVAGARRPVGRPPVPLMIHTS